MYKLSVLCNRRIKQNANGVYRYKRLYILRGVKSPYTNQEKEQDKMKEGIHPEYYQATVTCNCGNTFVTGSTKPEIHVEVCSKCHSFYTGQQKAAQARGRIDKFNRKYGVENK